MTADRMVVTFGLWNGTPRQSTGSRTQRWAAAVTAVQGVCQAVARARLLVAGAKQHVRMFLLVKNSWAQQHETLT